MKKSIFTLATLLLVFSLSMVSCKKDKKVDKGTVELNPTEKTIVYGQTYEIKPVFSETGEAKNQNFHWESSNEEVATVEPADIGGGGKVEAKRIGEAIISYKSSDLTAKSKVIVEPRTTLLNGFIFEKNVNKQNIINRINSQIYTKDKSSNDNFLVFTSENIGTLVYEFKNNKLIALNIILDSSKKEEALNYIKERFNRTTNNIGGVLFYENTSQTSYPIGTLMGLFVDKEINGKTYAFGVKVMDKSAL